MEWDRLSGLAWVGMDTAAAFFPWYSFLGEQLRHMQIPVWNPHEFSGAPFAADPESGWMYLPAMLAFAALPLDAAVRASLLFNILLAGLSTYALARVLGANPFGGFLAATIYAHSGFFEGHNVCCYAYANVAAWLPLSLLGAELAIRATDWRGRSVWCGVAGLAMSQILAAWIGQGAYYAALVVGGYLACRAITATRATVLTSATIGLLTLGLAAAGLLPRLEYNAVSNLPGGYPDADVSLRATTWHDWGLIANPDRLLLQPGFEYIGWLTLLLALAAVPLMFGRRRPMAMLPFFAGLALVVLILARAEPTPLHALLSLLPGFERIHARSPERAIIVFYLAPATLAAATLTWLTTSRQHWHVGPAVVGVAAIALVSLDLHLAWVAQSEQSLAGGGDYQFARLDLTTYFEPTAAAAFLAEQASGQPPFRYFGYIGHVFGGPMPYTLRWADPHITALEVNNRAIVSGLSDIQGYNPVHVARYDDLVSAVNGHSQNYHHTDIFDTGFDSPLLDVLNVRYVVMPTTLASDEMSPHFNRQLKLVYADDRVHVFENPAVLPRAWLVHAAQQVSPRESAHALTSVDPRRVAILEEPPPPLAEPDDPSADEVQVVSYADDRIVWRARTSAAALLVASEVTYPAWHAYVDDQPVPMRTADVALRGVDVPPGQHVIEMRYESTALRAGLAISLATALLLLAVGILHIAFTRRLSVGSGEVRCKTGAVPQL